MLLDTGSYYTILAPRDARQLEIALGISVDELPAVTGGLVGIGISSARRIASSMLLGAQQIDLDLMVMPPPPPVTNLMPSILGRNALGSFTLLVDDRNDFLALYE